MVNHLRKPAYNRFSAGPGIHWANCGRWEVHYGDDFALLSLSFLATPISPHWRRSKDHVFGLSHCSSALTPSGHVAALQPQGKARAELGMQAGLSPAKLHLLLRLLVLPSLLSSARAAAPKQSPQPHFGFGCSLDCWFCLRPDLPQATQRGKLHPNSQVSI